MHMGHHLVSSPFWKNLRARYCELERKWPSLKIGVHTSTTDPRETEYTLRVCPPVCSAYLVTPYNMDALDFLLCPEILIQHFSIRLTPLETIVRSGTQSIHPTRCLTSVQIKSYRGPMQTTQLEFKRRTPVNGHKAYETLRNLSEPMLMRSSVLLQSGLQLYAP